MPLAFLCDKLWYGELIEMWDFDVQSWKFAISKSSLTATFSSESPNCASASHAAEFVQGAVPLGITLISWETITKSRQTRYAQTSLDFYCFSHSFAKCRNVRLLIC